MLNILGQRPSSTPGFGGLAIVAVVAGCGGEAVVQDDSAAVQDSDFSTPMEADVSSVLVRLNLARDVDGVSHGDAREAMGGNGEWYETPWLRVGLEAVEDCSALGDLELTVGGVPPDSDEGDSSCRWEFTWNGPAASEGELKIVVADGVGATRIGAGVDLADGFYQVEPVVGEAVTGGDTVAISLPQGVANPGLWVYEHPTGHWISGVATRVEDGLLYVTLPDGLGEDPWFLFELEAGSRNEPELSDIEDCPIGSCRIGIAHSRELLVPAE